MPMLVSKRSTLSDHIENIASRSGTHIEEFVRNTIRCDIRNIRKKQEGSPHTTTTRNEKRETRIPLSETTLSCSVTTDSSVRNSTLQRSKKYKSKIYNEKLLSESNHSKHELNDVMDSPSQAKNENTTTQPAADDLTSLQWLTGVNVDDIFDGKPIQNPRSPGVGAGSEDGDDKRSVGRDVRQFPDGSVDYRQKGDMKPPYSYAVLIIMAMKSKGNGQMTLSEIYKWIADNFVFYRNAETAWQNSIRHNLSLNKCFVKIPRKKSDPGKGGYWSIVPEFANRLLENSIRKRRSATYDYECDDVNKRRRLDLLESELLYKIKEELKPDCDMEKKPRLDELPSSSSSSSDPQQPPPVEIVGDLTQCRIDHTYGKSPVVDYNISDEENIRAIATHLEETTSNVATLCGNTAGESTAEVAPNTSLFSTLERAMRNDCIWSPENNGDTLKQGISKLTEELLDGGSIEPTPESTLLNTLNSSLSSSTGIGPSMFSLSPPLSGDDDDDEREGCFSGSLDGPPGGDMKYLAVQGTSMTLLPTNEMVRNLKEEPLSPNSLDSS